MSRSRFFRVLATIPAIAAFAIPGYAFAKGKPNSSATALCWATPNPVAVGGDFAVAGSGLPSNVLVNVWVTDSVGTQWTSAETSAAGEMSVPGHASYSGAYAVRITSGGTRSTALATCSFAAQ